MLKYPEDLAPLVQKRFCARLPAWLEASLEGASFEPLVFRLEVSRLEAGSDIAAYNRWEKAWRGLEENSGGCLRLRRTPAAWQELGRTERITHVELSDPQAVFALLPRGKESADRWMRAVRRLHELHSAELACALAQEAKFVFESDDADFQGLVETVLWLAAHRPARCYVRELPVEGVDTKWFERHRALCARFLTQVLRLEKPLLAGDVEREWELLTPPQLVCVRHAHRIVPGLKADDFVGVPLSVLERYGGSRVLIVENKQTGLSLRAAEDTLIVCGMGRSAVNLARLGWMHRARIYYMGDLDQHGLAILAELRTVLPNVTSLLMDEATLKHFRPLAVHDSTERLALPSEGLTAEEIALFDVLQASRLRLEQERIPLSVIDAAIARLG